MPTTRHPTKAELKKARAEAARAAAAAAQRRSRNIRIGLWSAVGAVVLAIAIVVIVVATRPDSHPAAAQPSATTAPSTAPPTAPGAQGQTGNPPWAAPLDASAAVTSAGLPMLGAEGTALHIHTHLDVIVNGAPVAVPAEIGVDEARQQISPLHSHDTSGVIHVESPDKSASFTLGQFFTEWQVPLGADHIGGLTADATHHLKAYVNGALYQGDPAGIKLAAHEEIALVYGTDAQQTNVPSSYTWTNGL